MIFANQISSNTNKATEKHRDFIDSYYDGVQIFAMFLSMIVIGGSLSYLDTASESCSSIVPSLIWAIVSVYVVPLFILCGPMWWKIIVGLVVLGMLIAIPIVYSTADSCPGEEAADAYVLSAMITFACGIFTSVIFFFNMSKN